MPYIAKIGVLAATYAAAAKLGLMLDPVAGFATLVWPPSGHCSRRSRSLRFRALARRLARRVHRLGALRFGPRGATATTFLASAVAIAGTAYGFGPFNRLSLHESLLQLQVFMATMAVTSLALGALHSERAALLDQERRAHAAADRAIASRDDFLSVAAHERRTPLSALMLQLASLKEALKNVHADGDAGRLASKIDRASRQTDRLAALIEALLSVQAPPGVTGDWDRMRMDQVVTNLLSNAMKYGSGAPIAITVVRDGAQSRVEVRDHGIGIAQNDLNRIFGIYERAVSTRHYGGLGMGLFIARQIAEAHGGTIRATSEHRAGSTFVLELPHGAERLSLPMA